MEIHEQLYLLKVGELVLKRGNRNFFEKRLRKNIKQSLAEYSPKFVTQKGRMFLRVPEEAPQGEIIRVLKNTAGIHSFAPAVSVEKDMETILTKLVELVRNSGEWRADMGFKVNARRADKSFPLSSYEICCEAGEAVLNAFPESRVNLHTPDYTISLEIRNKAYIYTTTIKGPGGLPVGTAGRGLLLLSGGIDSPVAGFRMALRGLKLDALYFHTYPYTSDEALEKVRTLAKILREYSPGLRLFVVPFTEVQLEINRRSKSEEHTLIMRYVMVQIANRIADTLGSRSLITGESLSQVASQTVESLTFTNSASERIIFRPLIGLDKEDIITTARKIGSYETSILPYEDCCTIFSPAHPLVKPELGRMQESIGKLDLASLIDEAVEKTLDSGDAVSG